MGAVAQEWASESVKRRDKDSASASKQTVEDDGTIRSEQQRRQMAGRGEAAIARRGPAPSDRRPATRSASASEQPPLRFSLHRKATRVAARRGKTGDEAKQPAGDRASAHPPTARRQRAALLPCSVLLFCGLAASLCRAGSTHLESCVCVKIWRGDSPRADCF